MSDGKKGNDYPEFYCQLLSQETSPGAESVLVTLRFLLARGSSSARTFCQAETARPVCELLVVTGHLHFPD